MFPKQLNFILMVTITQHQSSLSFKLAIFPPINVIYSDLKLCCQLYYLFVFFLGQQSPRNVNNNGIYAIFEFVWMKLAPNCISWTSHQSVFQAKNSCLMSDCYSWGVDMFSRRLNKCFTLKFQIIVTLLE
jgi:hypothetical protein